MGRPVGVTILSILDFVGAAFCGLGGIGMIAGGGFMATMLSKQSQNAGSAGLIAGMGAAFGVILIICAAVYFLLGWGLLKLKEWARIVTIVFAAIGAVFQLFGLIGTLAHMNIGGFLFTVAVLAIQALIIWYLLTPEVKAAFQRRQSRAASA